VDEPRYFGLVPYSEQSAEGRLGFFVGIGRLTEASDRVLRILPRRFDQNESSFRIDYLRLYATCAAEPEIGRHLDRCPTVYADEPLNEAPDENAWSPLIALAYMKALHDIVQRHLRRGFIARNEDLRSRIRGQIVSGRYAAQSLSRGRADIVPCSFRALEQDTLENRILRTALAGAWRL
jgi:5-methylcytosine-specific restriction enzyme subunit McrC